MRIRSLLGVALLTGTLLPVVSCNNSPSLTSIVIAPTNPTTELALLANGSPAPAGDQIQTYYTATGYYTHPGHPPIVRDITDQVTWYTYTPDLVTVSTSGVATPAGNAIGYTQITASMHGFNGDIISNSSTFTVTLPSNITTTDVISLTITPTNPSILTGQSIGFNAIGTTGTGTQINLTNQSTWGSSSMAVCAIVATTGNCTTTGAGTAAITATYTNADGIQVTGFTTLKVSVPTA